MTFLKKDDSTFLPARRGTLFHQTLIFMTIASILMAMGGLCLHTMLKADVSQRRESQFLSSLIRLEAQLRKDARDGSPVVESETSCRILPPDGTILQWRSEYSILHRRAVHDGETVSMDRFIFPAGSRIQFVPASEDAVIVRVTEPSAYVTYAAGADGGTNLRKPSEQATPPTPSYAAQPNVVEIRLKGGPR